MKIYTRKGDDGTTGLLYGGRVPKDAAAPTAYGSVDEAQAAIGVARAEVLAAPDESPGELADILVGLERGTSGCSWPSWPPTRAPRQAHRRPEPGHRRRWSTALEVLIDEVSGQLRRRPPSSSSRARPGWRRSSTWPAPSCAEPSATPSPRPPPTRPVLPYLNRLSDLLWTLARWQEGTSLTTRSPLGAREKGTTMPIEFELGIATCPPSASVVGVGGRPPTRSATCPTGSTCRPTTWRPGLHRQVGQTFAVPGRDGGPATLVVGLGPARASSDPPCSAGPAAPSPAPPVATRSSPSACSTPIAEPGPATGRGRRPWPRASCGGSYRFTTYKSAPEVDAARPRAGGRGRRRRPAPARPRSPSGPASPAAWPWPATWSTRPAATSPREAGRGGRRDRRAGGPRRRRCSTRTASSRPAWAACSG